MEGNLLTKGNTRKASSHSSINAQSMKIRKVLPQVEKLRLESLPMSPLSLNGSLTTVDVCDTSFGKGVIEEMETTNADIPDASFSEEVLQDMDYSLDALREAVPVMCLKKKDDSYDDSDIFEEMSAYQVMGIFNNKDSQRRDEVSKGQNDKASELKNKRLYPDKNIDNLYQNAENDDNSNKNEIECIKHPGKKIDDHKDKLDDLLQYNEKDMNNNDSECSMETTETSANEYDELNNKGKISLLENNAYKVNSNQDKKLPKEKCQKIESLGSEEVSNKSLFDDLSHIKGDDNKVENSSKVKDNKYVKENDKLDLCNNEEFEKLSNKNEKKDENIVNKDNLSNLCKKGEYKELVKKDEKKDSASTSDMTESKAFPIQKDLNEHKDKNIHKNGATVQDKLHDKSEFANLNDSMRNISEGYNREMDIEANCGTAMESNRIPVSSNVQCSTCDFTSPKKSLLQQHNVFYHDKWQFQCSECGLGYNTKGALEHHKLAHWGCKKRKRKFKCSRCSTTYFFQLSLQKHKSNCKNKKVENIKTLEKRRPKRKKSAFIL